MTTRRQWLKSALAAGAGLPLSLTLANELMATPVSRAEWLHGIEPKNLNQLVRLGSNENPYGPSDKARKAIVASISEGNRYAHGVAQERM